ncbi:MAG: NlpC/P60 family protein [Hyphomicrobiales bacterium]|nr:NlpC/P60 family protein [Hyphomicrobiales bacterium]
MNSLMDPKRLDPRRNAYREDVAAKYLEGRVRAVRFTPGEALQVSAPFAALRSAARFDAPVYTEALSGELMTVYEFNSNWAWGQLQTDGYVGYMPADCLSRMIEPTTHRVANRATFVYPAPDIKAPPFMRLSFGAELIVFAQDGKFAELSRGGFVFAGHLVSKNELVKDYVRVAERFVGAPYLWGGKTSNGVDCSGLVQIAFQAAGMNAPRDSDMQEAELGEALPKADVSALQRGDLIFWKGHVAIATSPDFLIHANAYHMETAVEPVRRAIERIAAESGPVTSIRRLHTAENIATPVAVAQTTLALEARIATVAGQLQSSNPGSGVEIKTLRPDVKKI